MGMILSRYMDPRSSEGALIRFALDSASLVHTVCTADSHFPDLTPWNVIDFATDDLLLSLSAIPCWPLHLLPTPSAPAPVLAPEPAPAPLFGGEHVSCAQALYAHTEHPTTPSSTR